MHFWDKSAATSSHISRIGQALEPQKCWKYGQNTPNSHATCTCYRGWPAQCTPNLSHACHTVQILPTLVYTATKTAHSGLSSAFARIISIMGLVWAPNFLLDTTHMRLQNPSKSLGILRYLEVSKSEKRRPNCADDAGLKKHAPNPVCVRVHRDGLLTL